MKGPTPVERARMEKQAREAKMEAAQKAYRAPRTQFEAEAAERFSQVRASNKIKADRKRFTKELTIMPFEFKLKVRALLKAHDNYESLPGYREFAAGRATVRSLRATLEQAHKDLESYYAGQKSEKKAARDARDEVVWQDIQAAKLEAREKAVDQDAARRKLALKRSEQRKIQQAKYNAQKAEVKAKADAVIERQKIAREKIKAKACVELEKANVKVDEDRALHPFQEGSPPVSQAIMEVSQGMGVSSGELDHGNYNAFVSEVYRRAQQLRKYMYYYKAGRSNKYYYNSSKNAVRSMVRAAGYILASKAQTQAPAPSPRYPAPAQLPTRATATTSKDDPVIQEALWRAVQEAGLQSGARITDIEAFARHVQARATEIAQKAGKTARRADVIAAINARIGFVLSGKAS